jgi:hypothetical protein
MYGTLIASTTVGAGGSSSIDFTSIPQTYTDLFVILSARFSSQGNARLNLNSSGAGFSSRVVYSFATNAPLSYTDTVGLGRATSDTGDQANNFGAMQLHLPNYRSGVPKSFSSDAFAANYNGGYIVLTAGVTANITAAITSLSLLPPTSTTFLQNTTAYLYGVLVGTGGATVTSA